MDDIVAALDDQQVELDEILRLLDDAGWATASRCPGWSVADVVTHLAQTNEMAIGSLEHRFDDVLAALTDGLPPTGNVDDGAGVMVERERGAPSVEVYDRWRRSVNTLMQRFWDADAHERVQWVAGTLSTHTLATTRLAETWIHTNDIAQPLEMLGLGIALAPSTRLRYIARLAWRTLPYAFARAGKEMKGAVAFELTGPSGQAWTFAPEAASIETVAATTIVRGTAVDLCEVAAQRAAAPGTSLVAEGPDADDVLALVRTFA